jgi:hypothetical protein
MAKKVSSLRQYLNSSKSLHYSLILTLPAVAIYEIGILILFRDSFFELRNTGEILLRSLFESLGLTNPLIVSAILLGLFIITMVRGYKIEKKPGIHANYYYLYAFRKYVVGFSYLYQPPTVYSATPATRDNGSKDNQY